MAQILSEDELAKMIADNEVELNHARAQTNEFRKKFIEAETRLIAAKQIKERLVEQLRVTSMRDPKNVAKEEREIDIDRFKLALPNLIDKYNKE